MLTVAAKGLSAWGRSDGVTLKIANDLSEVARVTARLPEVWGAATAHSGSDSDRERRG
jgi:hypothetical protein